MQPRGAPARHHTHGHTVTRTRCTRDTVLSGCTGPVKQVHGRSGKCGTFEPWRRTVAKTKMKKVRKATELAKARTITPSRVVTPPWKMEAPICVEGRAWRWPKVREDHGGGWEVTEEAGEWS